MIIEYHFNKGKQNLMEQKIQLYSKQCYIKISLISIIYFMNVEKRESHRT